MASVIVDSAFLLSSPLKIPPNWLKSWISSSLRKLRYSSRLSWSIQYCLTRTARKSSLRLVLPLKSYFERSDRYGRSFWSDGSTYRPGAPFLEDGLVNLQIRARANLPYYYNYFSRRVKVICAQLSFGIRRHEWHIGTGVWVDIPIWIS